MSAPQTSSDIPLLIKSANSASERRVTPAWTIAHLKTRLEPITGIPASAQKLSLRVGSQDAVPIEAADEENFQLHSFNLQAYAEIFVSRIMLFNASYFVRLPFSPILRSSQAILSMGSRDK
jgi:tubulin-folding cofactor B